jgi:tellurite methyltransferase
MATDDLTRESYDEKYGQEGHYWTLRPSAACLEVLRLLPPDRPLRLLDIGCGEGRNAIFFARNGYVVDAMDISGKGVAKTVAYAEATGVQVNAFEGNVNTYRLTQEYDVLYSTAVFQCIPATQRPDILENYKHFTKPNGIHAFSVFVRKPFIAPAPDGDPNSNPWKSGELLTYYHDWQIESCSEDIFDCMSSGVPHRHAMSRMIARKPG